MTKHPSTTRRHLTLLFTLILSLGATWAQPTGAINGIFSVAEGQYVYFAKGNLQYNAMQGTHATADGGTAQGTWRFADNQWDYVGSANCNISQTYDGWIDLFGYGTSGWNSGATCYQPWSVSTSNYDYYLGGTHWTNCSNNMEGDYANADWGVYNAISNGGNQPGLWRTLSKDEWDYVFRLRNTLSGIRWARAVVNGVNGLILLPDAWKTSYYSLNGTNDYTASYDVNVIDASTWMNYLESHGAVFFSACGYRGGPTTTANYYYSGGSLGWYHSTTYYSEASSVLEINGYTNAGNLGVSFSGGRYQGLAVRLIQQVPNMSYSINPTCNPTDGGTVLGAGVYIMGSICTLRAIANGGYTFVNWTENGSVVSTDDIYSFCVVGTRNLVANFYYTGGGGVQNGHGYVDLGLPSGLMWATCNIGAVAPEDYGDYFAWAETQPKEIYEWSNYQYCEGTDPFSNRPYLTKYCCNPEYGYNGFTDNLTTLLPEDDAASVYWGADWRIPSKEEFEELINNTTSIWTTQYGVNGRLFTAANGNSIFLPANGIGGTSHSLNAGIYGNYWSNSILEGEYSTYGRMLWFRSNACETDNSLRYFGLSIRPVRSEIQYEVTATSNPILGGTITGAGAYHQGQLCTLTATANTGYVFVNWTEDGNVVSTNPEYNFTVSSARNLVANFAEEGQTCNIVFDLYDSFGDGWNGNYLVVSYGDVTEQFTVGSGSSASYSREVATGSVVSLSWITGSYIRECSFDIKFENGVLIYHGANLSASFQEELTIDCELATAPYLISATSDPSEGGIVEGGGVYEGGSTCTLTATPNSGYSFICWLENGQQVSTNATYSFTVTGNQDLVAHFSVPLTITALSNSSEGGSVTGGGVFDYGTTCTLTATANPGYSFIKWTKNGETVSYFSPFSFSVTEGGDYSAVFEETDGIVVGAPEAANQYLPSYSFYEYSLSQQIYMPDEIGGGTFITGISFFNTGDTKTRNYDIYLVHTDKSAFSSNTDWIAVAESDRVFSGDVTMMSGCWTMIVFDTPFAYNGTSNLAVVIDDNSGNYTYSPHMSCRVFHTENTQAIRIYNIETNYDPFNPSGYNGTLYSEKNQIVFQTSPAFAITASASPSEGGTITGAGS